MPRVVGKREIFLSGLIFMEYRPYLFDDSFYGLKCEVVGDHQVHTITGGFFLYNSRLLQSIWVAF